MLNLKMINMKYYIYLLEPEHKIYVGTVDTDSDVSVDKQVKAIVDAEGGPASIFSSEISHPKTPGELEMDDLLFNVNAARDE